MIRVRDNNVGLLGKRSPDSTLVYLFLGTRVMFICSIFETDIGYTKGAFCFGNSLHTAIMMNCSEYTYCQSGMQ